MINLNNNDIISISVNIGIFLILVICSIIIVNKLKLEGNGYKYLFWIYTLFWIPIMLVRPYRGTMQNAIDSQFTTIVLMVYGAIGIFIRIFADIMSYLFKYRKIFLYFCLVAETALFIPLIINPNTDTNIASAIGIGIGASCIGTYELLFKEQYGNKKAFLTVSVLAIPPLLANFLTAPIQSILKTAATVNGVVEPNILRYMWVISLPFIVIAFIMLLFLKEKPIIRGIESNKKIIVNKSNLTINWIFFICISIIGSIIAFIKFSNSDAVATLHLQNLSKLTGISVSSFEGYLSVVFSIFQLIASVLMGMYLINKISTVWIFTIGSVSWIIFEISSSFITNPIAFMGVHCINGFGYGILYNLTLAIVLKISTQNKIITKMGIYQSVLAIGITFSGFYTDWVKKSILGINSEVTTLNQYMNVYFIQNMILIGIVLFIAIWFIVLTILVERKDNSINSENNQLVKHHNEIKHNINNN